MNIKFILFKDLQDGESSAERGQLREDTERGQLREDPERGQLRDR